MRLEGESVIPASPSHVSAFLRDLKAISQCIPSLDSFTPHGKTRFALVVRPALSFLPGMLTMECAVTRMTPSSGCLRIAGKTLGGSFTATSQFTLTAHGKGTLLRWAVDATRGGLLKPVPESLVVATVTAFSDRFLSCLSSKVKR